MDFKRPLFPTARTQDQVVKRLRLAKPPPNLIAACLHCGSALHTWVECTNVCAHCLVVHCRRRCVRLSVAYYSPGGFGPAPAIPEHPQEGTANEIHAERAAMIATTPISESSRPSELILTPGLGPQQSGSNTMPLGSKKYGVFDVPRNHALERETWRELEHRIREAVKDTAASGKPFNGKRDRPSVEKRMNQALALLKPIIRGGTTL